MPTTSEHSQRLAETATAVRAVFLSLAKLISAKTIYTGNNPTLARFAAGFQDSVHAVLAHEKELQLRVEQYRILWHDEVVYESEDRGGSIAFMLFKDGVGELTLHASVTAAELDQLVDILKEEIHNPTPTCDTVTRLWNADFANISYRVLDEDPTGQLSDERGGGARVRSSLLQAVDHPGLPGDDARAGAVDNRSAASIAAYLLGVVTASHPDTGEKDKEQFIQDMLSSLFSASEDERQTFLEEHAEDGRGDKIALLLETALDFTRSDDASTLENAMLLVERAAGYAIAEANARTLARSLTLIRTEAAGHPNEDVRAAMRRLERDFVAVDFLRTLGRSEDLPTETVLGVLRYLRLVGPVAVAVIQELLHIHSRSVIHREACDALLEVTGGKIDGVIQGLNLDNVHIARDVVYLLGATRLATVPPLLRELVHYPDVQVRAGALKVLASSGRDDAVPLLCVLLDDEDRSVRLSALDEVERLGGVVAASKVMSLCREENGRPRNRDEMTRLYEVAGRIAGDEIVSHLEQTLKKRSWLRLGAQTGAADKLLAIAALRHAAGDRARALLGRLSRDGDATVSTRAQQALDERGNNGEESA